MLYGIGRGLHLGRRAECAKVSLERAPLYPRSTRVQTLEYIRLSYSTRPL